MLVLVLVVEGGGAGGRGGGRWRVDGGGWGCLYLFGLSFFLFVVVFELVFVDIFPFRSRFDLVGVFVAVRSRFPFHLLVFNFLYSVVAFPFRSSAGFVFITFSFR